MKHRIRIVLMFLVVAVVVGGCGSGSSADEPPWGLDSIDLPDTEEQIAAVFDALADEIGGRESVPGAPLLRTYQSLEPVLGDSPSLWHIWAEDIQSDPESALTVTEFLASEASYPSAEASAINPNGDLMWVALYEATEQPTAYGLMWAEPAGSWVFFAFADSQEGRQQLLEAFKAAAGGKASWVITALAFVIMVAIGWWFFRYSRSVLRGDYRHPKDLKQTWWVAGGGTHGGGGGQVPPLLPNHDPDDEIR